MHPTFHPPPRLPYCSPLCVPSSSHRPTPPPWPPQSSLRVSISSSASSFITGAPLSKTTSSITSTNISGIVALTNQSYKSGMVGLLAASYKPSKPGEVEGRVGKSCLGCLFALKQSLQCLFFLPKVRQKLNDTEEFPKNLKDRQCFELDLYLMGIVKRKWRCAVSTYFVFVFKANNLEQVWRCCREYKKSIWLVTGLFLTSKDTSNLDTLTNLVFLNLGRLFKMLHRL